MNFFRIWLVIKAFVHHAVEKLKKIHMVKVGNQDIMSDVEFPGWTRQKCVRCDGHGVIAHWDIPDECPDCGGSGSVWKHTKSLVVDKWPGGPFLGQ